MGKTICFCMLLAIWPKHKPFVRPLPATLRSRGCVAVKPLGSHRLRNALLMAPLGLGLGAAAGALISRDQYQVEDADGAGVKIGRKLHGRDLKMLERNGTRVVLLDKHYSGADLRKACFARQ